MKKILVIALTVAIVVFIMPANHSFAALAINIINSPTTVEKYAKYEIAFTVGGVDYNTINPFNPNLDGATSGNLYQKKGIQVNGLFKLQSQTWSDAILQPAFFNGGTNNEWKLRFSAKNSGTWVYKIQVQTKDSAGQTLNSETSEKTFTVTDPQTVNHGFIQVNSKDPRFFQYEDGTPFYPIGAGLSGVDGWNLNGLTSNGVNYPGLFDEMKAAGMNYMRIFQLTATGLELMGTDSTAAQCSSLNNYDLGNAATMDDLLSRAEKTGVYLQWLQEDWEKLKDTSSINKNTYLACGSTVATTTADFFSLNSAKEIYKRKLRYIQARWGYSPNLMSIELINELGGGGTGTTQWHKDMADYLHSFKLKHMVTSSNGSEELRTGGGIPWNSTDVNGAPHLDYVNYHSYAKYTNYWTAQKFQNNSVYFNTVNGVSVDKMGSTNRYPWVDTAVWVNRITRAYMSFDWKKPLTFTEIGLGYSDWNTAYLADWEGRHIKDALWAGALSGSYQNHWKLNAVRGYKLERDSNRQYTIVNLDNYGKDTNGDGKGDIRASKYPTYTPLSNYLKDVNMTGLKHDSTYTVADPLNTAPRVISDNGNIMAMAMSGTDKSYLYVKNATNNWSCVMQLADRTSPTGTVICDPSKQVPQSGNIKVSGLQSGVYNLETWSTTETDPAKQMTVVPLSVGADGIATIAVSNLAIDTAYKLKYQNTGSVSISSSADKTSATANQSITITNTIKNTKPINSTGLKVTNYIPYKTKFVSATDGGTSGTVSIACTDAAQYGYPACTGSFNISTVTWNNIEVATNSEKKLSFTVQVEAPPVSYINLTGTTAVPIEAEDPTATLSGNMAISSDTNASGGKYISTPDNSGNGTGTAAYKVDATASPGKYYIWANTYWLDTAANSFSLRVDSNSSIILGNDSTSNSYKQWHWVKLGTTDPNGIGTPISLTGKHTITLSNREDGGKLDRLILSTDPAYDPRPATPPTSDTIAPKISFGSPANNSAFKIRSNISVTAQASDNVKVTKVEFYLNDKLVDIDTTGTVSTTGSSNYWYSTTWPTRNYSAGQYTLTAKAYDASGNVGQAQVIVKLTQR